MTTIDEFRATRRHVEDLESTLGMSILSSPSVGGMDEEFGDDTIRTALQIARRLTSRDMRTHH